MNVLSRYHPIPLFFYFLFFVLMTAFAVHPVLHLISLICAFLLICLNRPGKDAAKSALRCLILIAATGILNPIFSHDGVTVLFFLQNNPVTLESILFGVFLGVRICGVLLWCSAFEVILTGDKIAYLLSRLSERSSLLFSMTLRFIPLYLSEWKKLRSAQKALGLFQTDGVFDRLRAHLALFSALVSRSLERAMGTASALRARGYGVKKRTLL